MLRVTAVGIGMALSLLTAVAAAEDGRFHFHRYTLTLDMIPDGPVHALWLAGGEHAILVHGHRRGVDHIEVFRMVAGEPATATPIDHRDLPTGALAFDVDPGDAARPGRLLILDAEGVLAWAPGGLTTRVVRTTSILRAASNPDIQQLPMLRDADGDGINDLLIPDFGGWWWARGAADGSYAAPLLFPVPVSMRSYPDHVEYRRPEVVITDGHLLALIDGAVHSSSIPELGPARTSVSGLHDRPSYLGQGVIISDDDADQSDLEESGVYLMDDLTGDGVPDVLIQTLRSAGVFDKASELRLHPGTMVDGELRFREVPSSQVRSEGLQFSVTVRDLDGDGRSDLLAPSVHFSFTRVIAALLSGGFRFDLNFYRQRDAGMFPTRPDYSMDVRVDFDMGSGFVSQQVVALADLDGDGSTDLVVNHGDDQLELRHGVGGDELFDDDEERIEIPIPEDGRMVQVVDLDADGRDDLVLRYGPADPDPARSQLVILLGRTP